MLYRAIYSLAAEGKNTDVGFNEYYCQISVDRQAMMQQMMNNGNSEGQI